MLAGLLNPYPYASRAYVQSAMLAGYGQHRDRGSGPPVIGTGSTILCVKVAQQGVPSSVPDLSLPTALCIVPADTLLISDTIRTSLMWAFL